MKITNLLKRNVTNFKIIPKILDSTQIEKVSKNHLQITY